MDNGYIEGCFYSGFIKVWKSFMSICWGELSGCYRFVEIEMWNYY